MNFECVLGGITLFENVKCTLPEKTVKKRSLNVIFQLKASEIMQRLFFSFCITHYTLSQVAKLKGH